MVECMQLTVDEAGQLQQCFGGVIASLSLHQSAVESLLRQLSAVGPIALHPDTLTAEEVHVVKSALRLASLAVLTMDWSPPEPPSLTPSLN